MIPVKSILVCIDESNLRRSLLLILERAGYSVDTVENSREAFSQMQSHAYDLTLIDFKSPQENYNEFITTCHALRPQMPLLVLTPSNPSRFLRDKGWAKNQAYLEKPIDPPRLLAQVGVLLKRNQETKQAG